MFYFENFAFPFTNLPTTGPISSSASIAYISPVCSSVV